MKYDGPNSPEDGQAAAEDSGLVIIHAQGGSVQELPAGAWVLKAEFVREGPDLLLVGANGQKILIRDFFQLQNPPDLALEGGLLISAQVAVRLAGPLAPGEYAQAAPAGAAGPIGGLIGGATVSARGLIGDAARSMFVFSIGAARGTLGVTSRLLGLTPSPVQLPEGLLARASRSLRNAFTSVSNSPISVLLILLPVAGPVIVFVVFVLAAHRVGRAFGYGGGMPVLAVLLPPVWATVLIWIMLATALWALRACTTSDRWLQQAPIAIYAGWLTAASVVALMLCLAGYDIGLGMTGWGWIGLALATGLAVTVQRLSPHAPEYGLTVIWALTGIIAANWGDWLFVLGAALGLGIVGWTIIATRQERA